MAKAKPAQSKARRNGRKAKLDSPVTTHIRVSVTVAVAMRYLCQSQGLNAREFADRAILARIAEMRPETAKEAITDSP